MKITQIIIFFFSINLVSCQSKFNKEVWLKENKIINHKSKRVHMTEDLIANYLSIGMEKNEVINLLGKPNTDAIRRYIPKNIEVPDSLNIFTIYDKKDAERDKYLKYLKKWREDNYQFAPMLTYFSGWSLMDPNFLIFKLDSTNKVTSFWIEQH